MSKTYLNKQYNVLSLFSNIGVAEAYLEELGVNVCVANEIDEKRANLYSQIYPHTKMVCGDITKDSIKKQIVNLSLEHNINVVIATPPCQGMSTVGMQDKNDIRNSLICEVVDVVNKIRPEYIFIENVPMFYNTEITIQGKRVLITDYLKKELSSDYLINEYVVDVSDYSVPQIRERAILLITNKKCTKKWVMPRKDEKKVTLFDAIGNLPSLDPFIKDITEEELFELFPDYQKKKTIALKISKWHKPPVHIHRQVLSMLHTPTGNSAFDNEFYYPKKENGEAVKGYRNTYKRQNWNTPAYTVTMDNRKISSQNNVHPGRKYIAKNGEELYSDPRALTLYEIMIVMSLPLDWPLPNNVSEAFVRRVIGEGIPPLFVKKVFSNLVGDNEKWEN